MATRRGSGASKSVSGGSKKAGARAPKARPSTLGEELEEAAKDLRHQSESDYPYQFFTLPAEGEADLNPQGFLIRLGLSQQLIDELNLPLDRVVEERAFDGFFPGADELADHYGADASAPEVAAESKRYRKLEATLKKRLRGLKVLRVGQVEIRCYVAGLDERGYIAGLVTTAIET
jgi:Nuclease A inhibitor-like protein